MWFVRELGRLLVKVAIAFAVAFALALVQAPLRGGSFVHGLQVSCWVVGGLLLVMAAMPPASMFERQMDYGVTQSAWGRVPGVSTLKRHPEDPRLNPVAVFAITGLALLAVGLVL
jgi:hypothetical protein